MNDLLTRYGDDVYRLAFYYMGNRQDAEDVSQSVFLTALAECDRARPPEQIKAWLLRVTSNECKSLHRSFWRRKVGTLEGKPEPSAEGNLLPYEDLYAAIARLSFRQKQAVWLYYFDGLSTDEIAKTLGLPPSTVRNRLARARKALGEMLDDEGGEPIGKSI